ncbi:MAG: glycosyltransferase family 2 protein [Gammaproteobacteria bacterium]|nr:glycosyltransferase family 2 protein [Gammaproteobacteria bacterium]
MPVYNGESYIRKALDALLGQTYTDFELVISDNLSTDSTWAICSEYAARDSRIKIFRQPENMGAMGNFQFVLGEARRKYFMWAACDDVWDKDFISECVACLDEDAQATMVFPRACVMSAAFPLLSMKTLPDLSFVSNEDACVRIKNFIFLDESSHKANVIYGVWRVGKAKHFMEVWKGLAAVKINLRFSLDGVACAIFFAQNRAVQIDKVLFYKYYRYIPPGHSLGNIVAKINFNADTRKKSKQELVSNNAKVIKRTLKKQGVWSEKHEKIIAMYIAR